MADDRGTMRKNNIRNTPERAAVIAENTPGPCRNKEILWKTDIDTLFMENENDD